MIQKRTFAEFPLVENVRIEIAPEEANQERDDDLGGQDLKKEFKLPKLFFQPDFEIQKPLEMKGYRFFIPHTYTRNKDKESECYNLKDRENIITFQVKDPVPIDFLDKMSDKERDLKLLCESIVDDFLKNQEIAGDQGEGSGGSSDMFLIASKPYVRKNNLIQDKSLNHCWEIHMRFNEYDLYITILRRSYIPPIMDQYQDIVICSKIKFDVRMEPRGAERQMVEVEQTKEDLDRNNEISFTHLNETHRKILDSIHQIEVGSQVSYFKVILEDRANALLMSEDTMNFYQYNLQIMPSGALRYVVSYLMRILNILLKYNSTVYKEMSKLVRKTALKLVPKKEDLIDDMTCP
mmetsp:Transcript_24004/g.36882  ORF Transcript_24004/g.36882 Transcript_24004/m.36882 type:complete len:350 (+) Transcript_24004:398-1447(+)